MTIAIQPHRVFNLVKTASYEDRLVEFVLPDQRTPILLETSILLSLAKVIQPRTYFEFGTYLGLQLLNVAANMSPQSRLYTLDLDEESAKTIEQDVNDRPLTVEHLRYRENLAFLGTRWAGQITRLYGDSNTYDFSAFYRRIDLIYIDGGHDPRTLESDTENSLRMLSEDRPSCVVWHDYGNKNYPRLKEYIDALSRSLDIFAVEETWMTFYFHKAEAFVAELKNEAKV